MSGPFARRGTRIDRGSLVYAGLSGRETEFLASAAEALRPFGPAREILEGTAAGIERRSYVTAGRGRATIAVYAAAIGKDLYGSWTLFSRRDIDALRLVGLLLVALVLAVPGGVQIGFFSGGTVRWDWAAYFGGIIPWVIVLGVLVLWAGITFRRDLLGFLRAPLNEFQLDDADSLREAALTALRKWTI